jgi:hypothetical protein
MIGTFAQVFVLYIVFALVPFAVQIVAQAADRPVRIERTDSRADSEANRSPAQQNWIRAKLGERSSKKALIPAVISRFARRCGASAIKTSGTIRCAAIR